MANGYTKLRMNDASNRDSVLILQQRLRVVYILNLGLFSVGKVKPSFLRIRFRLRQRLVFVALYLRQRLDAVALYLLPCLRRSLSPAAPCLRRSLSSLFSKFLRWIILKYKPGYLTDQFGYLESSAAGIRQTRFVQIKRLALATAIGGEEERARDGDFPSSFKHRLRSSFTLTELRARPVLSLSLLVPYPGLWGWQCKSSPIAKENCALRCLSPLEEGEKDLVRSQEYKYCMYK
ncbi:hypothetical protein YC2023_119555 [Brassica napus]